MSDVIGVYLIFNVIIVKFCEWMIDFEDIFMKYLCYVFIFNFLNYLFINDDWHIINSFILFYSHIPLSVPSTFFIHHIIILLIFTYLYVISYSILIHTLFLISYSLIIIYTSIFLYSTYSLSSLPSIITHVLIYIRLSLSSIIITSLPSISTSITNLLYSFVHSIISYPSNLIYSQDSLSILTIFLSSIYIISSHLSILYSLLNPLLLHYLIILYQLYYFYSFSPLLQIFSHSLIFLLN